MKKCHLSGDMLLLLSDQHLFLSDCELNYPFVQIGQINNLGLPGLLSLMRCAFPINNIHVSGCE